MQRMVLMLCVGVVLAFVVPPAAVAQSWIEYRPAGAGYRVEMPGTPIVSSEDLKIEGGRTVTQIRAIVDKRRMAYMTSHADYPDDIVQGASPDTLLKRMRDAMVQNRKVRRDVTLAISGVTGREFVTIDRNGFVMITRTVLSGNRAFQVIVGGPDGIEAEPDTLRFLESFTLVK